MNGIDVSNWQHPSGQPIEWTQVKAAGYDFVIVKLTQGINYINPFARNDIEGARAAGLIVGGYCFASPLGAPSAQASYGLDFAQLCGVDFVFVDIEAALTSELPLAAAIIKQFQLLGQKMGIEIGVYGSLSTLTGLNVGNTGTPVWGAFPAGVTVPDWNNIVCIQSGQDNIPGINVETDVDEWVKGNVLGVKPTTTTTTTTTTDPTTDPTPAETITTTDTTTVSVPTTEDFVTAQPRHPIAVKGDQVVGITPAPTMGGYWAITRLGQVLCYGGAQYHGEPGAAGEFVGITSISNGYVCVTDTGELYAFGDAADYAKTAAAAQSN